MVLALALFGGLPAPHYASLAIGLIRPFSLLLTDEPFDGLDPPSRAVLPEPDRLINTR